MSDGRAREAVNLNRILSFIFRKTSLQLHEDWLLHWRDWTAPGFRAISVYRFGVKLLAEEKKGMKNRVLSVLYRMMYRFIRNHYGIDLPATTVIGRRLSIPHPGGIVVHPKSVIGDDCIIHQNSTLGAATVRRHWEAPKLGNRVQVGAGVAIVGKVIIGDNVSIAPNATVMTSIPENTIVCAQSPRLVRLPSDAENTLRDWDIVAGAGNRPDKGFAADKE